MTRRRRRRQIQELLTEHVADRHWERPAGQARRATIDDLRHSYAGHVRAYLELPVFPGERELWRDVSGELDRLDGTISRVLALADVGRADRARETLEKDLRQPADRTSAALARSIQCRRAPRSA